MRYTLGVDFGGSGVKGTLLCETGSLAAVASTEYPMFFPKDGWSEQDPEQLYEAFCKITRDIVKRSGAEIEDIAAVAISSASMTGVYLDEEDKVIRRSIHWTDIRGSASANELKNTKLDFIWEKTTNPPAPSRTLNHIIWMRDYEPESYKKIRKIMFVKDYIRYRLTGDFVTDYIDAMGSQFMDVPNDCWSKELCSMAGICTDILPKILKPTDIVGPITEKAANESGLSQKTKVIVGTTDTCMEVYANGAISIGDMTVKLATAGRICSIADHHIPHSYIVNYKHVVPGLWYPGTGMRFCAASYRWYRDVLGTKEIDDGEKNGKDPYDLLNEAAEKIPPGSENLFFHPYLQGEHINLSLRGSFIGLRAFHTKGHFTRALLEGISYGMRETFEVIRDLKLKVDKPILIGGGAKGPIWRQIMADMFGVEMVVKENSDSSLGSAMLAGVAVGVFTSFEDSVAKCVRITDSVKPNPEVTKIYDKGFVLYKEMRKALEPVYGMMEKK